MHLLIARVICVPVNYSFAPCLKHQTLHLDYKKAFHRFCCFTSLFKLSEYSSSTCLMYLANQLGLGKRYIFTLCHLCECISAIINGAIKHLETLNWWAFRLLTLPLQGYRLNTLYMILHTGLSKSSLKKLGWHWNFSVLVVGLRYWGWHWN